MSSGRLERLRHALGFRLGVWYALLFVTSSLVFMGLTYGLLAASLRQRDRQLHAHELPSADPETTDQNVG